MAIGLRNFINFKCYFALFCFGRFFSVRSPLSYWYELSIFLCIIIYLPCSFFLLFTLIQSVYIYNNDSIKKSIFKCAIGKEQKETQIKVLQTDTEQS